MSRVAIVFLAISAPLSAGEEKMPDPRALLDKAVKAHGDTHQGRPLPTYLKATIIDKSGKFTMEAFRSPDGRFKETVPEIFDRNGRKIAAEMLVVFDGKKGWNKIAGVKNELAEFTRDEYEQARRNHHLSRVSSLVDVLRDPAFSLSYLGEDTVAGIKVQGVRVSSKGQADVRIYFDKATNLIAALRWHEMSPKTKKEIAKETVFSGYRDLKLSSDDEKTLQKAGVPPDGPSAVAFLRKLFVSRADRDKIRDWIGRLGDPSFKVREEATARLKSLGPAAIPFLQRALKGEDEEAARRARVCLEALQKTGQEQAVLAAVRQLAFTRPPGAVDVLLDLADFAADDTLRGVIREILVHLAETGEKSRSVLVKALAAKEEGRRRTAAAVLGRDGGAFLKQPGRRLYLTNSKFPGRIVHHENGKQVYVEEVLDVHYFNALDERLFDTPKE
jgi:hypothetical protein